MERNIKIILQIAFVNGKEIVGVVKYAMKLCKRTVHNIISIKQQVKHLSTTFVKRKSK